MFRSTYHFEEHLVDRIKWEELTSTGGSTSLYGKLDLYIKGE